MANAKQKQGSVDREYQIGGGAPTAIQFISKSRVVGELLPGEPGLVLPDVSVDPSAKADANIFFFRDRGDGKHQLCVRYPTGAIQILATEP